MVDSLEHQIITHLFVSIVTISACLSHKHSVDKLLGGITMLIDQSDLKIEIIFHLLNTLAQNDRID